jgi:glycosyltransferase involved in cell wall biosynthesis
LNDASRLKVLLLSHFFETHGGGIELVVRHLAREFAGRGMEVRWAATAEKNRPAPPAADFCRVPMHSFNLFERVSGFPYPIWTPTGYPELVRSLRWADVIHVHDAVYFGSQFAWRYAKAAGKAFVLTQHIGEFPAGFVYRTLQRTAMALFSGPLIRRADAVAFVGDGVRDELSHLRAEGDTSVIYNGLDTGVFRPSDEPVDALRTRLGLDPAVPVFLFVGRFSPKKRLDRIREAAVALPDIRFALVGSGRPDPATWNLSNILLPGRQAPESLADWYRAADLLVLPSVGEGFPLVLQEAMACGTPCLVTEETRGGCLAAKPHLLSAGAGSSGFVERCAELGRGLPRLQAMRADVAAFAAATWSWSRCADQYLEMYADAREAGGAGLPGTSGSHPPTF